MLHSCDNLIALEVQKEKIDVLVGIRIGDGELRLCYFFNLRFFIESVCLEYLHREFAISF